MAKKLHIERLEEGRYKYGDSYLTIPESMSELAIDDDIYIHLSGQMDRQKYRQKVYGETKEQYMDYLEFINNRIKNKELYIVENDYKKVINNLNI